MFISENGPILVTAVKLLKRTLDKCFTGETKNKYAIYAYTHGPVTGSGPSVV